MIDFSKMADMLLTCLHIRHFIGHPIRHSL